MAADRQLRQGDFALDDRAPVGEEAPRRFALGRAPGDRAAVLGDDGRLDGARRRGRIAAHGGAKAVRRSAARARAAGGARRSRRPDERGFRATRLRTGGQAQRRQQRELGLGGDDGASARDVPPIGRYPRGVGENVDLARVGRAEPRHAGRRVGFREDERRARGDARAVGDGQADVGDRIVGGVDERAPDLALPRLGQAQRGRSRAAVEGEGDAIDAVRRRRRENRDENVAVRLLPLRGRGQRPFGVAPFDVGQAGFVERLARQPESRARARDARAAPWPSVP